MPAPDKRYGVMAPLAHRPSRDDTRGPEQEALQPLRTGNQTIEPIEAPTSPGSSPQTVKGSMR